MKIKVSKNNDHEELYNGVKCSLEGNRISRFGELWTVSRTETYSALPILLAGFYYYYYYFKTFGSI